MTHNKRNEQFLRGSIMTLTIIIFIKRYQKSRPQITQSPLSIYKCQEYGK